MKKIIQIFSIFGMILSISIVCNSCKTIKEESSLNAVGCPCNDMNCWAKQTNTGRKEAVACGIEAAATIVAVDTKISDIIKDLVDSGKTIASFLIGDAGLKDILIDLPKYVKNNKVQCTQKMASSLSSIISFFNNTGNAIFSSPYQDTILEGVSTVSDSSTAAGVDATTLTEEKNQQELSDCFTSISKMMKNEKVQKLAGYLGKFLKAALVVHALSVCGWSLTKNSIKLYANSQCTISDMNDLYESYDTTQRQGNNAFNQRINCTNELKKEESIVVAQHYGMALQKNHPYTDKWQALRQWGLFPSLTLIIGTSLYSQYSQPYYCFDACYHKKTVQKLCNTLSLGTYLLNENACKQKCIEQEYHVALDLCVSYCCGDTSVGKCVNDVKQRYKEHRKKTKNTSTEKDYKKNTALDNYYGL